MLQDYIIAMKYRTPFDNTQMSSLFRYLKIIVIGPISRSMRQENIVCYNIRFDRRLPCFAEQMSENRASPGSLNAVVVTLDRDAMRLIESHPMFHSVTKSFETDICIVFKIISAEQKRKAYVRFVMHYYCMNFNPWTKCFVTKSTYTTWLLNKPSYLSSSTCGRSQWYSVT